MTFGVKKELLGPIVSIMSIMVIAITTSVYQVNFDRAGPLDKVFVFSLVVFSGASAAYSSSKYRSPNIVFSMLFLAFVLSAHFMSSMFLFSLSAMQSGALLSQDAWFLNYYALIGVGGLFHIVVFLVCALILFRKQERRAL